MTKANGFQGIATFDQIKRVKRFVLRIDIFFSPADADAIDDPFDAIFPTYKSRIIFRLSFNAKTNIGSIGLPDLVQIR